MKITSGLVLCSVKSKRTWLIPTLTAGCERARIGATVCEWKSWFHGLSLHVFVYVSSFSTSVRTWLPSPFNVVQWCTQWQDAHHWSSWTSFRI